jgi:predicted peroxiredoxin
MANYILIESRDPFESRDTQFVGELATALKERGNEVTVFLVQNAVLATRRNAHDSFLTQLLAAGIKLLADDFSLCERGIHAAELRSGIRASSIDALVGTLIQENTKAMWH